MWKTLTFKIWFLNWKKFKPSVDKQVFRSPFACSASDHFWGSESSTHTRPHHPYGYWVSHSYIAWEVIAVCSFSSPPPSPLSSFYHPVSFFGAFTGCWDDWVRSASVVATHEIKNQYFPWPPCPCATSPASPRATKSFIIIKSLTSSLILRTLHRICDMHLKISESQFQILSDSFFFWRHLK